MITGVALTGLTPLERFLIPPQIPLWRKRWYWRAQAAAFGIPADDRDLYVESAVRVAPDTNRRIFREVAESGLPSEPFAYTGPILAVAGEKEQRSVRDSFGALGQALPQLQTWVAPGMHHPWNIEDPDLFTTVLRTFADTGDWKAAGEPTHGNI